MLKNCIMLYNILITYFLFSHKYFVTGNIKHNILDRVIMISVCMGNYGK